jgi:eukaryotic-like serine/threonine-protein kinase
MAYRNAVLALGRADRPDGVGDLAETLEAVPSTDPAVLAAKHEVAWRLVADPGPRSAADIGRAVRLARAVVAAVPSSGHERNTLGVALYRAGDWAGAIAELEASDRLLDGDLYGFNGFFLAMAEHRLGRPDRALRSHDRSVAWMERHAPADPELQRFRAEAEALLTGARLDAAFPPDPFAR